MNIKDSAKAYKPQQTKNIADLEKIPVDLEVSSKTFETVDADGNTKIVDYNAVVVNEEEYRLPNSVLRDLKVLIAEDEELQFFKVIKTGEGLKTTYTVIPQK